MTTISQDIINRCNSNNPGSILPEACGCVPGFVALQAAVNEYQKNNLKYDEDYSKYQKYLTDKSNWAKKKSDESTRLENTQYNGPSYLINWIYDYPQLREVTGRFACGGCIIDDGNVTYTDVNNTWEYNPDRINVFGKDVPTMCHNICKLTPDGLQVKLNDWVRSNPPPTEVAKPVQPSAPSNIDIQCCINLMKDLNASNINNNTQSCLQTITKQIVNATQPSSSQPSSSQPSSSQPSSSQPSSQQPTTSKLNINVIIIIIVVVVLLFMLGLYLL